MPRRNTSFGPKRYFSGSVRLWRQARLVMAALFLSLFDQPRLQKDGEPLELNSRKGMALLAVLAVDAGRWQSRDRLAALLWPDSDQNHARTNLRRLLYRLRRTAVGGWLEAEPERVTLRPGDGGTIDVVRFAACYAEAASHAHETVASCPRCLMRLREAVELYRGDFLADFYLPGSGPFEEWVTRTRLHFQHQALQAWATLTAAALAAGQWEEAERLARRQLEVENLREAAWRQLLAALANSGQPGAALAEYQALVALLRDELAVRPARETRELHEAIVAGELAPVLASSPRTPYRAHRPNLPTLVTPLIGRKQELADLESLLTDGEVHLVSIVAPGGMGKTRLALEAGHHLAVRFADGVTFADLTAVQDLEGIVRAVAHALCFTFQPWSTDEKAQLLGYLQDKALLLILDNFEHLIDSASILTEIVQAAPGVKLLVTSRERLRLQTEHIYPLQGLAFSQWEKVAEAVDDPAAQLFLHHARRVRPSFVLQPENLRPLQELFRLVEGMPLAVILAAAWVALLSPAEIAAEIAKSLDFLEAEYHDLPERQRSMRAVFASSWARLSKWERPVFAALSVFRGGFTREAAREVAAARPQDLRRLVERSLLARGENGRFHVHELLRQFAAAQLARSTEEEEAVRQRHSSYYCAFLQQREEGLKGPRSQEVEAEIAIDFENVRTAWNWAVDNFEDLVYLAQTGLGIFCELQGRWGEAEAAFLYAETRLAKQDTVIARRMAELLAWASWFVCARSQKKAGELIHRATAYLREAASSGEDHCVDRAFVLLAQSGLYRDVPETRVKLLEESLSLYQELDKPWELAWVHNELAFTYTRWAKYQLSSDHFRRSLQLLEIVGDRRLAMSSKVHMARAIAGTGQLMEAERRLRDAFTLYEARVDEWGTANALLGLGEILGLSGRFEEALATLAKSRTMYTRRGHNFMVRRCDSFQCWATLHLGEYGEAQLILGGSQESTDTRLIGLASFFQGSVDLALHRLDEARLHFEESATILRAIDQPDQLGWAQAGLGYVALAAGELATARKHLAEVLRLHLFVPALLAMPAVARLLAEAGEPERAVEFWALAKCYPFVANSRWFADVAGRKLDAVAASLSPEVVAVVQERGRARDLWQTTAELAEELSAGAA